MDNFCVLLYNITVLIFKETIIMRPTESAIPAPEAGPNPARVKALKQLGERISELSAHLDAGEYQLLKLVEEFDRELGWGSCGVASCAHWLNWKCGIGMGAAREKVRVARALPDLPRISEAFRKGRISYSKVRAMTRVATARNEDVLLNVALHGTASHVEKQVQLYRRVKRIEALQQENERHAHRQLSWSVDDEGYWQFRGRFTSEQGALLSKALEAAMNQIFEEQPATKDEPPTREPVGRRRADALERMADHFLANSRSERHGGDRYLVNIHTNIETLKADGNGAESELEGCCHVSAATSRRMACDASVVHWHEAKDGEPLNIGRKSRTIPPAIRRALRRRDQGCRFPGCDCTRFVDAHHIVHWADGGETKMNNLLLLCRKHHRLVHEGGFGVKARGIGRFVFTNPNGMVVPESAHGRSRGNVSALTGLNRSHGVRITAETPVPRWRGEQMDHELAVLGLVQRE